MTSVKLSPTGSFVLLGCSRGNTENQIAEQAGQHPVAAIWRLGDMARMETLSCGPAEEDDANVALFHPHPGGWSANSLFHGGQRPCMPCDDAGEGDV